MHLLLGDSRDPCCLCVRDALETRNQKARLLANPFVYPARFSWNLDSNQSATLLALDAETALTDDDISGVFVRSAGWIDPAGWDPPDLAYMQTETQAALLGWLWSLPCPVINRYSPSIWYRPRAPLLSWHRLLRRCGLPTLETLITNIEQEMLAFRHRLAETETLGAILGPLTSEARYMIASEEDWRGLAGLQQVAPVILTVPHEETYAACVVRERVVWDGAAPPPMVRLEPELRQFAALSGLDLVELVLAPTRHGVSVIGVETTPHFERYGADAQQHIVEAIVSILTGQANHRGHGGPAIPQGRFA
jgi:hypothetical protein